MSEVSFHSFQSLSFHSTILVCKRRIVDLFPKLEKVVENIKTAEAAVMQMQMKRQKEFWYLLKIACVSIEQMVQEIFFVISELLGVGSIEEEIYTSTWYCSL